jgi:hypothetical protein
VRLAGPSTGHKLSAAVPELPVWPQLFTRPAELIGWLDDQSRQYQKDPVVRRHLLTIRWLVLAELDRTAPELPPKSDFFPCCN